jgi:methylisocitrate lyase
MVEHGRTPVLDQARLAKMGFDLILYPLTGLYAATHALTTVYQHLRECGTTTETRDSLMTFQQFNDLIGVGEKNALSEKFRGDV